MKITKAARVMARAAFSLPLLLRLGAVVHFSTGKQARDKRDS